MGFHRFVLPHGFSSLLFSTFRFLPFGSCSPLVSTCRYSAEKSQQTTSRDILILETASYCICICKQKTKKTSNVRMKKKKHPLQSLDPSKSYIFRLPQPFGRHDTAVARHWHSPATPRLQGVLLNPVGPKKAVWIRLMYGKSHPPIIRFRRFPPF